MRLKLNSILKNTLRAGQYLFKAVYKLDQKVISAIYDAKYKHQHILFKLVFKALVQTVYVLTSLLFFVSDFKKKI